MPPAAPAPSLYDKRAERTYAAGLAAQQQAAAEAVRADAAIRLRRAERQQMHEDAVERERIRLARAQRWRARRRAAAQTVRGSAVRFAPAFAGGIAMGAPILLAWSGQLAFGAEVMLLGPLAIMVPIALEGAVWYVALLEHRAGRAGLPTGIYRAWAWILAAVAASMNFWHGATSAGGAQRGAVLALASLLGVGLWQLTICLRAGRQRRRTLAQARTSWARRIRYPRISWTAWSIRTALGPDCTPEAAWAAAWERWHPAAVAPERPVTVVRRAWTYTAGADRTEPAVAPVRRAYVFRTVPVPAGQGPAEREPFVRTLTDEILAAADRGEKWGPDYDALIARARRSKSWVEKRVREARTAVFPAAS
ncbi:hypothetical protein ACIBHY_17255 [Nonomuraea sp. NPDC050547]|uniref:hypothetical protein n=1 Tax=Nonomuraea sp. NPDC050547 TaxID=3364368 RepID=UPI0037BA0843